MGNNFEDIAKAAKHLADDGETLEEFFEHEWSMPKCIVCNEDAPIQNDRYFVVPGIIMVPNCYALCDTHKDTRYRFSDFYNPDGTRKPLEHKN